VARVLGLPMDTDLGAITAKLAEGEWVEMDGRSGVGRGLDAVPQAGAPWTSAVCADGVAGDRD